MGGWLNRTAVTTRFYKAKGVPLTNTLNFTSRLFSLKGLSIMNTLKLQKISFTLFNAVIKINGSDKIHDLIKNRAFMLDNLQNWDLQAADITIDFLADQLQIETQNTFYKTWKDLKSAEEGCSFERHIDQMLHYWKGLIPNSTPKSADFKNVKIVETISMKDFRKRVAKYIKTNGTIPSYIVPLIANHISPPETILSRELRVQYISTGKLLPETPMEALKVIYTVVTESPLYVKSEELLSCFNKYTSPARIRIAKNLLKSLPAKDFAEVFNREKKLFMALKSFKNKDINKIVNRISKLSKRNHKPKIIPDYAHIAPLSMKDFSKAVVDLDTGYLVKIYNYLNNESPVKLYIIRNGNAWFKKSSPEIKSLKKKKSYLFSLIEDRIQENINKYNLSIPIGSVCYAIPTSAKKFIGNIPFGSAIKTGKNFTVGISWKSRENFTDIDADLSVSSINYKVGWDSHWSMEDSESGVYYSGDITQANPLATEVITFSTKDPLVVKVNNFNNVEDFTFFTTNQNFMKRKNPTIDMDKVSLSTVLSFKNTEKRDMTLGLIIDNTFYFNNISMSSSRVAEISEEEFMDSIAGYNRSLLKFSDLNLRYGEKEANSLSDFMNFIS